MEQWEQIIVEWINCLGVIQEPLKNTEELEDGIFYTNLLNLISWTKGKRDCSQNIITKFMEEEYPSFKINKDDIAEHVYVASLLLVHATMFQATISQATMFHSPMCNKLKHETQIRIKIFLENILPLGSDVTKDTMKEVIAELVEDITRTPNSRQTPPLRDFVNSPIMRSAHSSYKIMTERTRELRKLRCNLDVERFKNAELQDDIKIYQEKIQNLKSKLETKTAQLKELREEQTKPCTPQPRRKENSSSYEDYCKKYIDDLEIQLSKQQDVMDNLEMEKDDLSKALASTQRQNVQYKENLITCEQSLESLSYKMEVKDRELIEMRIHNEELRVRLKELNKNSAIEQSFEVEDSVALSLPAVESLNNSEALSSVIEIQLQEAKEESAILQAQVDALKGKLDMVTKNYKDTIEVNQDLQQKVMVLDKVNAKLNDVQKKLHTLNTNIKSLQAEKESLVAHSEELESLLLSKEKEFSKEVQLNTELSTKLSNLEMDVENLNKLLGNERTNTSNLNSIIEEMKSQATEHLTHIQELTDEKDSYKSSMDNLKTDMESLNELLGHERTNTFNLNTILEQMKSEVTVHLTRTQELTNEKDSYKSSMDNLKTDVESLNELLGNERINNSNLNSIIEEIKSQATDHLTHIQELTREKDSYRSSIDNLTTDVESLNELLTNERTNTSNLNTILEQMKSEVNVHLTRIQELTDEKDSYKSSMDNLKTDVESLNKLLRNEKTNTSNLNTTLEQMKSEVTVHLTRIQKLTNEKDSYKSSMDNLKTDVENLNELLGHERSNTSNLNSILEEMKSQAAEHLTRIQELTGEKDSYKSSINNLKTDVGSLNELLENERTNTSNLNSILEKMKSQATEHLTRIQELTGEKDSYKSSIDNLKTDVESLNELLRNERANTSNLNTILEQMKSEVTVHLTCIQELTDEKDSYKSSMDNLKTDVESLNELLGSERTNTSNLNTIIEQLKSQITEHLTRIQEVSDEKDSYKSSMDNLKTDMEGLNELLRNEKTNTSNLNTTLEQIKSQVTEHIAHIQELTNEKDSYKSSMDNLKTDVDSLNKLLRNEKTNTSNLNSIIEEMKSQASEHVTHIQELTREKDSYKSSIDNLKTNVESLNELLNNERTNISNLNSILEQMKSQITEHIMHIQELTDEKNSYKSSIENCERDLKAILRYDNQFIEVTTDNFDNMALNKLINYFNDMFLNYNSICTSYKSDIKKLEKTIDEINANLHNQQLTVATLKDQNRQTLIELGNIEQDGKQKDLLLDEQKETIRKYSQEIQLLQEIANEKNILEEDVCKLTKDLTNQQSLLKSAMTYFGKLQHITEDFKLIKQETQEKFIKYQEEVQIIFERIHANYQTLQHKLSSTAEEKEELKNNFNSAKEELSNMQVINATLQENLSQYQNKITALEEIEKSLYNDLNKSKQNVEQLQVINCTLEKQYEILKVEANNNLESLKTENTTILNELSDVTDKYNVLQQEMGDKTAQMELKNVRITELLSNVSSLKAEKDNLTCLHEEMSAAKDKEIESKEKALLMLQSKIEKVKNEANESETKMKEIIVNLQEIRSSQNAVLVTQETALREKCLHIEDIEKQFDKSKELLKKELEDEKLLHRELQDKFSELENQIRDRNKTVEELQMKLEVINAELEESKNYCKLMDTSQANIAKLCQELENPTKNLNSTIMGLCSDFDAFGQSLHDTSQNNCSYEDKKTEDILNIIKMALHELHLSQKAISYLSLVNAELNKELEEQKILIENNTKDKERICSLKKKIMELEIVAQKRNTYLNNLIKGKEALKDSVQEVFSSRNDLDTVLSTSIQKWNEIMSKFQNILQTENPSCDQFKQLQVKKASLDDALSKYRMNHLENIQYICDILREKFLWTEKKLHDTYLCSIHEKECLDILTTVEENQFSKEKIIIDTELEKNKILHTDVLESEEEMQAFVALVTSYENKLKSGEVKTQSDIDKKLQSQINQLTKEKKDMKNKMDSMRSRNVKLEKNMDDLRVELKKLKLDTESTLDLTVNHQSEVQSLKDELEHIKEENKQLHKERDELSKTSKQELENQLKEVHATYEQKLEDIKQKIKKVYNEQVTKLNNDQEKMVREKLQNQMESMCQKQREEINKYKTHVGELSSQLWSVGEKLLIEQQQKQEAMQSLKDLQVKLKEIETIDPSQLSAIARRTSNYRLEKQGIIPESSQQMHKVTVITEETYERRHSIRSLQAMGNAFKAEDEEEVFDNVYLADMKRGNCLPSTDVDRLSILQMRNAQCKPHLKSSYPTEMQFLPSSLTEEDIKSGSVTEDVFNDSLSQSLLPDQKAKKKDRTQTSYKKPGPPTPSKNGGRLSLQGNEFRSPSSRILRERNVDRRTTTTPHSLRHLFMSKRQDENASGTPKSRKISNIFRKPRMQ